MSYSLPQATQTSKLNSLEGDLRVMAEELIAKKFGIAEVIERPAPTPFTSEIQTEYESYGTRYGSIYANTNVDSSSGSWRGYRELSYNPGSISIREDPRTHSYIVSIADVSERTLFTVMRMMDMNNFRRRKSVLHVSRRDQNMLTHNFDFSYDADRNMGKIYEFEVLADYSIHQSYIEFFH